MNNEHDDDKRPFSERIKDGSYKLPPGAQGVDSIRDQGGISAHLASFGPPPSVVPSRNSRSKP
jgi:hypothetical protein